MVLLWSICKEEKKKHGSPIIHDQIYQYVVALVKAALFLCGQKDWRRISVTLQQITISHFRDSADK